MDLKLNQVKTKQNNTIEELFEAINDAKFTADTHELTNHGHTTLITFPPLVMNNQIWILPGQLKGLYRIWTVQKRSEEPSDRSRKPDREERVQ